MTEVLVPIPNRLIDVLRWAPTYHNRKNAILYNYKKSTEHYLICGKLLTDADKGNDWKHDGSCASGFYQWVEHELGIKRTQAQRMMGIWAAIKGLIGEHIELILDVDFTKLALIAPVMTKLLDDEEKLELIHMAKENTAKDVEQNLKEMKGEITQDACGHTGPYETYHKCIACGKFTREG